jgi:hypothetical protein
LWVKEEALSLLLTFPVCPKHRAFITIFQSSGASTRFIFAPMWVLGCNVAIFFLVSLFGRVLHPSCSLKAKISAGARIFTVGSQELCASEYPFHLIRYCSLHLCILLSSICSTSHSSCPSISLGGGSVKLRPCSWVSWYGSNRFAWNILWIFH